MGNICAQLKLTLLFLRWFRIRCLAVLKMWLSVDRKHIGWDEAIGQEHWNVWFHWYSLYEEEIIRKREKFLCQRLQSQAAITIFFQRQFYLKVVFDRHFVPQCLRKYIHKF